MIRAHWHTPSLSKHKHAVKDGEAGGRNCQLLRPYPQVTAKSKENLPLSAADRIAGKVGITPKVAKIGTRGSMLKLRRVQECMVGKHEHLTTFRFTGECSSSGGGIST